MEHNTLLNGALMVGVLPTYTSNGIKKPGNHQFAFGFGEIEFCRHAINKICSMNFNGFFDPIINLLGNFFFAGWSHCR